VIGCYRSGEPHATAVSLLSPDSTRVRAAICRSPARAILRCAREPGRATQRERRPSSAACDRRRGERSLKTSAARRAQQMRLYVARFDGEPRFREQGVLLLAPAP